MWDALQPCYNRPVTMPKSTSTDAASAKRARRTPNHCFGCGPDNPHGLRLTFTYDAEGKRFFSEFRLGRRFTGPPAHAHGGIIATILDEAMGKVNKLRQVTTMTREMTIEYLKPVPLGQPLVAEGRESAVRGRVHFNVGEIRNQAGEVLARSRGTFIAIDPKKLFAEHLDSPAASVGFMLPVEAMHSSKAAKKRRD